MEDAQIVEMYLSRDEQALSQTENKYKRLCFTVANNILQNFEDSEECVNDALLGAWNAIPPARPNSLKAFICKITRNLALGRLTFNLAQKRTSDCLVSLSELEEIVPDNRIRGNIDDAELGAAINRFLDTLKPDARNVFLRKYWYFDSLRDIMERYSFSESKVNNLLYRTRSALREYLEKEGITL